MLSVTNYEVRPPSKQITDGRVRTIGHKFPQKMSGQLCAESSGSAYSIELENSGEEHAC